MFKRTLSLSVGILVTLTGASLADWGPAVNLGPNINTTAYEMYPSISSDGTKLYFTSNREGGYGKFDIWVSEYSDGVWQLPVNLGPNINDTSNQESPSISSDGTKLYFTSYNREDGYGLYDIWVSEYKDSSWQPPVNLGPNINDSLNQCDPSISSNGMKLYFFNFKNMKWGIFISSYSDGAWQPPRFLKLRPEGVPCFAPCISPDSMELYFTAWLSPEDVRWAIWVSEYGDTSWQPATKLGPNINTPYSEAYPSISSDGNKFYFSSFRPNSNYGYYDIWVSEWEGKIEEGKKSGNPKSSVFLSQSSPNPSNSFLTINYYVPVTGRVTLKIYNNAGYLVKVLINEIKKEGNYTIKWDGTDEIGIRVPAGTYFYQLKVGKYTSAKASIILR